MAGDRVHYDDAVLERVSQRFRRDMWRSVVPEAVAESGVETASFGPTQATAFGELPEILGLNLIQGAAEPGAAADGHLAEVIEWMRSREVEYRVLVAEGRPGAAEAEAWLAGHGYERGNRWLKLVRDTSPPEIPEDPRISVYELGEDEADGEGMSTILANALEMPSMASALFFSLPLEEDWHCYTAGVGDDEILATASMLISEGVAMLGPGVTLERGRGLGCNTALLRRRLLDAAAAGCRVACVELGECQPGRVSAAYRIFYRAGFREAYGSCSWRRPAAQPAAIQETAPHR